MRDFLPRLWSKLNKIKFDKKHFSTFLFPITTCHKFLQMESAPIKPASYGVSCDNFLPGHAKLFHEQVKTFQTQTRHRATSPQHAKGSSPLHTPSKNIPPHGSFLGGGHVSKVWGFEMACGGGPQGGWGWFCGKKSLLPTTNTSNKSFSLPLFPPETTHFLNFLPKTPDPPNIPKHPPQCVGEVELSLWVMFV